MTVGAILRPKNAPPATYDVIQRGHEPGVPVLARPVLCECRRKEVPEVPDKVFVASSPGREQNGEAGMYQKVAIVDFGFVTD